MFNRIILEGRVGKDIVISISDTGVVSGRFSIAQNYLSKNKEKQTNWFPITIFSQELIDRIGAYITKGKHVIVEGYISIKSSENKNGEEKIYTDITATNIHLVSSSSKESKETKDDKKEEIPF